MILQPAPPHRLAGISGFGLSGAPRRGVRQISEIAWRRGPCIPSPKPFRARPPRWRVSATHWRLDLPKSNSIKHLMDCIAHCRECTHTPSGVGSNGLGEGLRVHPINSLLVNGLCRRRSKHSPKPLRARPLAGACLQPIWKLDLQKSNSLKHLMDCIAHCRECTHPHRSWP